MTSSEPARPAGLLTIGDVARLAGVTPRAIRHYHSIGVLPEPIRDASGYRRYDAGAVVAVVRVVRLRAVGMPLAQIASSVVASQPSTSIAASLTALADELDAEVDRLAAMRDRVRELIATGAHEEPGPALLRALQSDGLLASGVALDPAESSAAQLLDALHPQGMAGLLDQAAGLLADPQVGLRLGPLLQRFRALDDSATEADLDGLAQQVAAAVPRPEGAAPSVDVDLMDKLLGGRLTPVQRRFMRRLRTRMDAADA